MGKHSLNIVAILVTKKGYIIFHCAYRKKLTDIPDVVLLKPGFISSHCDLTSHIAFEIGKKVLLMLEIEQVFC